MLFLIIAQWCHWIPEGPKWTGSSYTVGSLRKIHGNKTRTWIPWNFSFRYILFHEKRLQTMLWHHNARVNSHQRWKQTRFLVCLHLWCELTSTMNVTEWQVSWNSCLDLFPCYGLTLHFPTVTLGKTIVLLCVTIVSHLITVVHPSTHPSKSPSVPWAYIVPGWACHCMT